MASFGPWVYREYLHCGATVSAATLRSRAPNSGTVCPQPSELTPTWNQLYVLAVIKHTDATNTKFQHFLEGQHANRLKKTESGCVTLGKLISVFLSKMTNGIR